ncbi:hypothetical protein E8E14_006318 [Neopestalotiopsis sp. 37M]|nr:hypothetical protein E8E14_006318 [Neopestalotiopsis sp. 37M]
MEGLSETAALPDDSVINVADDGAEEIEFASSDTTTATTTCSHKHIIVDCRGPEYETALMSADQDEKPNNDIQTTLKLVSDSIRQVADGLGEMVAVVKDIRDSVKPKGEETDSTAKDVGDFVQSKEKEIGPPTEGTDDSVLSKEEEIDSTAIHSDPSDDNTRPGDSTNEEQEVVESDSDDEEPYDRSNSEIPRHPFPRKVLPEIRVCDLHNFNESFCGRHTGYCVEVLLAANKEWDHDDDEGEYLNTKLDMTLQNTDNPRARGGHFIQDVRIQSRAVINRLYIFPTLHQKGPLDKAGPVTFHRPFARLIYYQEHMKDALHDLEQEVSASLRRTEQQRETNQENDDEKTSDETQPGSRSAIRRASSRNEENNAKEKPQTLDKDFLELQHELEEVRCYIEFVDHHIMPLRSRFSVSSPSKPQKIRYWDLWYLFKLGELIYKPPPTSDSVMAPSRQSKAFVTRQTIWRTHNVELEDDMECHVTRVFFYYIDFDGVSYGSSLESIEIHEFEGTRDITSLPIYPLRYAEDGDAILESAREDGSKFMALTTNENQQGAHAGWTLTEDPRGKPMNYDDSSGKEKVLNPEYIESDMVFDFNEACNLHPSWTPKFQFPILKGAHTNYTFDRRDYVKWARSPEKRSKPLALYRPYLALYDEISSVKHNEYLKQDPYLQGEKTKLPVAEDDLALLPKRIFGYALRERKFVVVNVLNVELKFDDGNANPFDKLQIEKGHKKMMQAIISSYFAKKRLADEMRAPLSQDLIRGKGKGVVILLHGLPGVGKSATAEAVAQKWNKPLFPITCGDLGDTAASVEKALNEIFRFAHLWECVLLLDEADVFITQRSKSDLKRNALVSAVKSRLHLSLRYEALTLEQTMAIFKLNIDKLKQIEEQRRKADIERNRKLGKPEGPGRKLAIHEKAILSFAEEHWKKHTSDLGRWNGRQIRNAFSTAASLAHFVADEEPELELPRLLTAEHFKEVEEATLLYDRYRLDTLQQTDSERALTFEERNDDPTSSS